MNGRKGINVREDWKEAALDAERRILDALENIAGSLDLHFEDIGPAVDHLVKHYSKVEGIPFIKPPKEKPRLIEAVSIDEGTYD